MRPYLTVALLALLLASCLKRSIPDAMLAAQHPGGQGGGKATLSYQINGNAVNISVDDADAQNPNFYTLGCTKSGGYNLDGSSSTGEITFTFYTDSLTVGNYLYPGIYGNMFFVSYNGQNEFVNFPTDSMSFNITSYKSGHISGNFSGRLTPLMDPNNNTYGTPGSISITKGVFQNVPVFY